ncbi:unnamed protein product, partial [Ectocarpus sp. 12 AP-2014]
QAGTGFCTRTLKGDSEWVRRVALSDDGEMLASCGNDHSVKVSKTSFSPHDPYPYTFLYLSPPPVPPAKVWSVHSGQCLHDLREHTHVVESVAFAPESAERTLATAVGSAGGRAVRRRFVASGSRDKTVKLWNASVGHCLMTFVSAD